MVWGWFVTMKTDRRRHSSPLFALMIATGMRRGEAVGLRWAAVDLDEGKLRVLRALISVDGKMVASEPKTKRSLRTVGLDPQTGGLLQRQHVQQAERRLALGEAWQESDLVFDAGNGSALHSDHVSKTFLKFVKLAGVPAIRLHDLRHTAATLMLRAGVPAKVASERLGHSNIGITLDTYTAFVPSLDEDAAARTAELIYGSG
jgi:integrase